MEAKIKTQRKETLQNWQVVQSHHHGVNSPPSLGSSTLCSLQLFERVSDGKLSACKVTFGAEPKDYEIYDFILKQEQTEYFTGPLGNDIFQCSPMPWVTYSVFWFSSNQNIEFRQGEWLFIDNTVFSHKIYIVVHFKRKIYTACCSFCTYAGE